jgi:fatty-acid desaturase
VCRPACETPLLAARRGNEADVLALFLVILLAAVVLGFLGVLLKGLFWLLVIGIVVFVVNLLFGGWGMRRHGDRGRKIR